MWTYIRVVLDIVTHDLYVMHLALTPTHLHLTSCTHTDTPTSCILHSHRHTYCVYPASCTPVDVLFRVDIVFCNIFPLHSVAGKIANSSTSRIQTIGGESVVPIESFIYEIYVNQYTTLLV